MKKIAAIIAILLMLPAAVFAENAQFETAGELWQHWQMEITDYNTECPYPDGVSGAWSADGGMDNLVFGITEDEMGEAAKADILAAIADDATAGFEYQQYSYRELWEARLEIEKLMGQDNGMQGIGIYEMENRIHVDMLEDHPKTQRTMRELAEEYPEMIAFEVGGPVVLAEEIVSSRAISYWWIAAIVIVAAAGIVLFSMRKRIFVHSDGTASAAGELTTAEVREMVKNADAAPSAGLEERIFK